MDIKNKKIIVTGGVSGIGRVVVDKLVRENAVVSVFDNDKKGLDKLKKSNPNIYCKACNVANYEDVKIAVKEFYNEFKGIDVLVNNAGILFSSPLISFSQDGIKKHNVDDWHRIIDINLNSIFYLTLNVVEKMILNRTKGVIINISSVSSSGNAGQSAYSAAKAGVNALSATWAKELGMMGIRVLAIAPGYTDTNSTNYIMSESNLKKVINEVPLRRLGRPEEIADAILFAIKNDYLNAKVIEVDGGLIIS